MGNLELDTTDIVRDGDISPFVVIACLSVGLTCLSTAVQSSEPLPQSKLPCRISRIEYARRTYDPSKRKDCQREQLLASKNEKNNRFRSWIPCNQFWGARNGCQFGRGS